MVNNRLKWDKKYRSSKKGKLVSKKFRRKYERTHYLEVYVRKRTRDMFKKTNVCFLCEELINTEFHHLSYKPNIFIELCNDCHDRITHEKNLFLRVFLIRDLKEIKQ